MSILSKIDNEDYFKVVSGEDYDLEKEVLDFKNQYNLDKQIKKLHYLEKMN